MIASRGSEACLQLAAEHGARYLLASTSEVYGDPLVHPQSETYWGNVNSIGPRSVRDESKRFGEALSMTCVIRATSSPGSWRCSIPEASPGR